MPIDASIPLQYHPTVQPENPVQVYGQLLSLKGMQAQQAQQAAAAARQEQLAPLHQQLLQSQVDIAQRQANLPKEMQTAAADYAAKYGPGATGTQPAAPAPQGTPPDSAPNQSPASAPVVNYTPAAGYTPAASSLQPGSTLGAGPARPAPVAVQRPAAVPTWNEYLTQHLTSKGMGDLAPGVVQSNANAQVAQLKALQAQQAENDEQNYNDAVRKANGNLDEARRLAAANGVSSTYLNHVDQGIAATVSAQAKAWTDADDVQSQKDGIAAQRLDAFRKKSPEEQVAQFGNFLAQLHADPQKLMSDDDYLQWQKLHPDGQPPTADQIAEYGVRLNAHVQLKAAAQKQAVAEQALATGKANLEKLQTANQDQLITNTAGMLAAASTRDQYNTIKIAAAQKNREVAAMFPDGEQVFDANGNRDEDAIDAIRAMGMSPQQQDAAAARDSAAGANADYYTGMLGVARTNADANKTRAAKESPAQAKAAVQAVVNKHLSANGGDIDKALASLADSADPNDQAYDAQARQALYALKRAGNLSNPKATPVSALEKMQWMKDHPGQPMPAQIPAAPAPGGGGRGAPAAAAPAGKIRVQIGNQTGMIDTRDFDPATMKKVGTAAPAGKIRVQIGNQTGMIDAADFDPATMKKL